MSPLKGLQSNEYDRKSLYKTRGLVRAPTVKREYSVYTAQHTELYSKIEPQVCHFCQHLQYNILPLLQF